MSFDYFTEAELRVLPDMGDTARYTTDRLSAAHDWIVDIIEREVGTSFVGRTITDEVHDGYSPLVLDEPFVISVTSATESGTAVTDTLDVRGNVVTRRSAGSWVALPWVPGVGNVLVTYVAGYTETPPGDIKEAALKAARLHLLEGDDRAAIDERRTSITSEVGTISLTVPDADHPTGYPSVDAVIVGWRSRLDVLGFA